MFELLPVKRRVYVIAPLPPPAVMRPTVTTSGAMTMLPLSSVTVVLFAGLVRTNGTRPAIAAESGAKVRMVNDEVAGDVESKSSSATTVATMIVGDETEPAVTKYSSRTSPAVMPPGKLSSVTE